MYGFILFILSDSEIPYDEIRLSAMTSRYFVFAAALAYGELSDVIANKCRILDKKNFFALRFILARNLSSTASQTDFVGKKKDITILSIFNYEYIMNGIKLISWGNQPILLHYISLYIFISFYNIFYICDCVYNNLFYIFISILAILVKKLYISVKVKQRILWDRDCAVAVSDAQVYESYSVDPAAAIESAATNNDFITQTVYGFLDFTTTIGNTVMVFSPQSAPPGKNFSRISEFYLLIIHTCHTSQ